MQPYQIAVYFATVQADCPGVLICSGIRNLTELGQYGNIDIKCSAIGNVWFLDPLRHRHRRRLRFFSGLAATAAVAAEKNC